MRYTFIYKLLVAAIIMTAVTACSNNSPKQTKHTRENLPATGTFGQPSEDTISYKPERIFEKLMFQQNFKTAVFGKVKNCSKDTGNWLILEGDSADLFVEVKDNAFVLPTNLEGKHVLVNGVASISYGKNGELTAKITANGVQLAHLSE